MKSVEEVKKNLFATLHELQAGNVKGDLKVYLVHKLETLYDILGDEVPEEYWEQIEEFTNAPVKKKEKKRVEWDSDPDGGYF